MKTQTRILLLAAVLALLAGLAGLERGNAALSARAAVPAGEGAR